MHRHEALPQPLQVKALARACSSKQPRGAQPSWQSERPAAAQRAMRPTPITDVPHPVLRGAPARRWVHADHPSPPVAPVATHFASSQAAPQPALRLRIMSYNVLSEVIRNQTPFLYRNVRDPACQWHNRMALILAEVAHYDADVVAMQEVQESSGLLARMRRLGYAYRFLARSGAKPDGCALFWCAAHFRQRAAHTQNSASSAPLASLRQEHICALK